MAENTKDFKLQFSPKKTSVSDDYTLKVPNFFTLPEYDDTFFQLDSPPFEFADATWCFRCESREKERRLETENWIKNFALYMVRFNYKVPEQRIFYTIILLNSNDETYKNFSDNDVFRDSHSYSNLLFIFKNHEPYYDTRDTLTLTIHLFDAELPVKSDHVPITINKEVSDNMTEKTQDFKLSLSPKTSQSKDYTLIVPNFFTLAEYDDTSFRLDSPSFEFANATWCFRCESRKKEQTETGDWIKNFALYMVRLSYEVPEQRIFYITILLNADDEGYNLFSDSDVFREVESDSYSNLMLILDNQEPYFDTRDTLTLIIHLFDAESALKTDQIPIATDLDAEILSKDMKKLFMNGKHHDLTLKVADKEFRVHQDVLMARSQVFEAMLSHDMTEKNEGVIDVPDCDPEAMESFLFYVYCGKVENWNIDIALGLYYLADKYNMIPLKEKCTEFIKNSLSISVICDVIQLALNHNDSDLLACATEFYLNHTNEILPTVGWMSFMNSNSVAANELFIKASKKWDCAKS